MALQSLCMNNQIKKISSIRIKGEEIKDKAIIEEKNEGIDKLLLRKIITETVTD